MKRAVLVQGIALVCGLMCGMQTYADDASSRGIEVQGEAVIERKPEMMRMSIELPVSGDNIADAVSKMKTRRTKVEQHLTALNAPKESWKFGEVRVDQKQKMRRKQLQMMIRLRAGRPGGADPNPADEAPQPVDLVMTVTAEWPLKSADSQEMLITAYELQAKIREADISDAGNGDDLSAEAAEVAEEMQGISFDAEDVMSVQHFPVGMNAGGGKKPGEPSFVFVAKISAAERQQALADAFSAARENANQLARAAGTVCGSLLRLSNSTPNNLYEQSEDPTTVYQQYYNASLRRPSSNRENDSEAIGVSAESLTFKVAVSATFSFK